MFDVRSYPYDEARNCFVIAGEAMVFHCHHYLNYLQRSILDADYIDSRPFIVGSAADAVYLQLSELCRRHSENEAKQMAADVYKTFGYGLIDLSALTPEGGKVQTYKSFYSKTWLMKFGQSTKPVDYFTTGYIAAAFAVIYGHPLTEVHAEQHKCIACGDEVNVHSVRLGDGNFSVYPPKNPLRFNDSPKLPIGWEYEEVVTREYIYSRFPVRSVYIAYLALALFGFSRIMKLHLRLHSLQ